MVFEANYQTLTYPLKLYLIQQLDQWKRIHT
nr:MAG TPA: hypothetical protein [Caudoviricetes sp.]DAX22975.1 MAG TPA: hypothetical protein [Caudoviricetes sp.]